MDTFYIKQGDTRPFLEVVLLAPPDPLDDPEDSEGKPINLTGATVEFCMSKHGGRCVRGPCEIVNAEKGHIRYEWRVGDTDESGVWKAEFLVRSSNAVQRVPNHGYLNINISPSVCEQCS